MHLQLIKGTFTPAEAAELLTQLVDVKIRFHENKIGKSTSEEDIKMREQRIKELQRELSVVKKEILSQGESRGIESVVAMS